MLIKSLNETRTPKINPFRSFCEENLDVEEEDWNWIYNNFKQIPSNMRVKSFAWKLVHGLCFTATRLKYFGFRETDICTLCNNNKVQNKMHYYFQCPSIEHFWELVCVKYKPIINKELGKDSFTLKEKTLGIKPTKENKFAFLNLLIISTQKKNTSSVAKRKSRGCLFTCLGIWTGTLWHFSIGMSGNLRQKENWYSKPSKTRN